MSPYMQHARRHLPGGTDPLEISGDRPFLIATNFGLTIPSGATGLTVTLADLFWDTSDSAIMNANGSNWPEILAAGVYMITVAAQLSITSAPAAGAKANIAFNLGALGLVANQECGWVGAANPWTASPGGTFYANEKAAYLPAAAPIVITQTSGVSASCSVELAMFQMNATPSSNGNV